MRRVGLLLTAILLASACSATNSGIATTPLDGGADLPTSGRDAGLLDGGGCALAANTTATSTVNSGCALLTRDTSSCMSARMAAGLSGPWLKFSCRVQLTKVTEGANSYVQVSTDDQPDYESNYFAAGNACYAPYTPAFPDPNQIKAQHLVVLIPTSPTTGVQNMSLGAVGVALNGVAIFDNQAAPGDDIFAEYKSFDKCQGHPQMSGAYHYHTEPYSISFDDDHLIGVLRDGYFVYGRRDMDNSMPTLDAAGGHMGLTPDSPSTPVYHHHLNLQTSTHAGTNGQTGWFITTGKYDGTPGTCMGC